MLFFCSFNINNHLEREGGILFVTQHRSLSVISSICIAVTNLRGWQHRSSQQILAQFNACIEISYLRNILNFAKENVTVPFQK